MLILAAQGWGGHMGWGGGWGWMMMLFWVVVLVAVLWFVWAMTRRGGGLSGRPDDAESVLRDRYARGEIDEAAYRRMLEELRKR